MKNLLRFLFIALVFATTCLFAQAAYEPVTTNDQTQQSGKVAKKKHRKHKKKARK